MYLASGFIYGIAQDGTQPPDALLANIKVKGLRAGRGVSTGCSTQLDLAKLGDGIRVELSQDKNPSDKALAESEKNWKMMLEGLKKAVES